MAVRFVAAAFVACCIAVSFARGATVTVSNCTDKAFCASGCVSTQLPTNQCLAAPPQGSQIIHCNPVVSVCGDLSYFDDSACTNLIFTDGFVCDRCNRDHNGNYNTVTCMRMNGVESLGLSNCSGGFFCGNCNNFMNVTAGSCIPVGNGSPHIKYITGRRSTAAEHVAAGGAMYAKYTGSTTCTGVILDQWLNGNTNCELMPTQRPELPELSCIDGLKLSCQF